MEIIKEAKEKEIGMGKGEEEETMGNIDQTTTPTQMETESQKETEAEEEKIMEKLIHEWKNLDDRFIPESQKQLYKEAFQKYKEKKGRDWINS